MGGAVSSGRDNNELIDNLMSGNYIRTSEVERVFRALDRAEYMTPEAREQAYKDLAWKNGPLHLSSPCIYSEVMEGLELKPGLSFLNVGSGTGYLSTLAGLILGSAGINHGVEVHPAVVEYAVKKIRLFYENSPVLDSSDFCEPKFFQGNGLCISPLVSAYDRVYCGAGCPEVYENYFKRLIKVGGVLVMPLNDTLLQVRRVGQDRWTTRNLLSVSFATLRFPTTEEAANPITLDKLVPVRLQFLARAVVREAMRGGVMRRNPVLREEPRPAPPAACPRRICIPIEPGDTVEGLNVLHDLDSENGANEMNALLSLVISMGQSRVAGALRFDRVTPSDSDTSDSEDDDDIPPGNPPDNPPQPAALAAAEPVAEPDDGTNKDTDAGAPNIPTINPSSAGPSAPTNEVPLDPRNDPRNDLMLDPRYPMNGIRPGLGNSSRNVPRPNRGSLIPNFEFLDSDDEDLEIYNSPIRGLLRERANMNNTITVTGTMRDADDPDRILSDEENTYCSSLLRLMPERTRVLTRKAILMSLYERAAASAAAAGATSSAATTSATSADTSSPATSSATSADTSSAAAATISEATSSAASDAIYHATSGAASATTSGATSSAATAATSPAFPDASGAASSAMEKPKAATESISEATDNIAAEAPRPELPGVPAEVEIDLGKLSDTASASTSTMDWEPSTPRSEPEDDADATSKPKRQKLDSGIGDSTPSVSSPEKAKTESSDTDSHLQSTCPTEGTDGAFEDTVSEDDRLSSSLNEDHHDSDSESPIESDSAVSDSEEFLDRRSRSRSPSGSRSRSRSRSRSPAKYEPSAEHQAHEARQKLRLERSADARRVRLSYLMKRAVRELPLPRALKIFVNLGRSFQY